MYHAYNTSGPGHYDGTQTKGELLPFSPMFVRKSPGGVFLLSMQITVVACQKGPPLFVPPVGGGLPHEKVGDARMEFFFDP